MMTLKRIQNKPLSLKDLNKISYKSPLRFPGGKARLVASITKHAPSDYREYREPFLGGGSVLFGTWRKAEVTKASDMFYELYNFWRIAQQENELLINQIYFFKELITEGRQLHLFCKAVIENSSNDIERAAAFFILNRISYSGLTLSGGYSELAYKDRFRESNIQTLKKSKIVLQKTKLYHDSYERLLFEPGKDVWIYLDPPYNIKSDNLYGIKGDLHKGFDHVKFAEDCKNSPHKWLISYNSNEIIKKLFSFANIKEMSTIYNMNSNNKRASELIITNY